LWSSGYNIGAIPVFSIRLHIALLILNRETTLHFTLSKIQCG
jgi:hypothetical protein